MSDSTRTVWQELKDIVERDVKGMDAEYQGGAPKNYALPFLSWLCHSNQLGTLCNVSTEHRRVGSLEEVIDTEDSQFIRDSWDPIALAKFRAVYGYGEKAKD